MTEPATSRPPLALVVNDKEWSARSIESILAPAGYAVLRASSGDEALKHARGANPDLIILDIGLPDRSGLEICRILRDDPRIGPLTPLILTTARAPTRRQRIDALNAGAWDFFPLPLDSEALLLKLKSYMKAKFEADRIQERSLIDLVTGLYNLDGLIRRARELGSEAYRHERALACVAFAPDLEAGEEGPAERNGAVLKALDRLTRIFTSFGRASDAIGQVRVVEFAIIAPSTDPDGAHRLARRLARAAEAPDADAEGTEPVRLFAGYYAAPNFRKAAIQPEEILSRATDALRRSQAEPGRGMIRSYNGTS